MEILGVRFGWYDLFTSVKLLGAIQSNSRKNFRVSMWKPDLLGLCTNGIVLVLAGIEFISFTVATMGETVGGTEVVLL